MANLMHKPCLYSDEATAWFMSQSKAALADMLTEVMRVDSGRCDDEAKAADAESRFAQILAARKSLRGLPKRLSGNARSDFLAAGGWHGKLGDTDAR